MRLGIIPCYCRVEMGIPAPHLVSTDPAVEVALILLHDGESAGCPLGLPWYHPNKQGGALPAHA